MNLIQRATARRAEQEERAQKIEAARAKMQAARAAQPEPTAPQPVLQPAITYEQYVEMKRARKTRLAREAFRKLLGLCIDCGDTDAFPVPIPWDPFTDDPCPWNQTKAVRYNRCEAHAQQWAEM